MKKYFFKLSVIFAAVVLISCSNSDSKPVMLPYYSLDTIAGYTYTTNFTSSSGKELKPCITIFNGERLDWNMSSSNMGNNQYYYNAVSDGFFSNVWTLYWYTTKGDAVANKTEKAAMSVKLGINSIENITVLVSSANAGAGSNMAGTPLSMSLNSFSRNTIPTVISEENQNVKDVSVAVSGEASEWPLDGEKIFYGSFSFLVGENGSVAKSTGSSGEGVVPQVKIAKTAGCTVSVTSPKVVYGGMDVMPFVINGVQIKKSGEIYYLEAGEFASSDGNYQISGKSVSGQLENGILTLRIQFIPGAMPFLLTEIFTSE